LKHLFKSLMANNTVVAIINIVFGLVLILRRTAALGGMIRILGLLLLVGAACYALVYFSDEEKDVCDLVMMIACAVVGLLFLLRPAWIVNLFPVIIGIFLIVNGVSNFLQTIRQEKKSGDHSRLVMLIVSAAVVVLGFVIMFHPGGTMNALLLLLGIALFINGVSDLYLGENRRKKNS